MIESNLTNPYEAPTAAVAAVRPARSASPTPWWFWVPWLFSLGFGGLGVVITVLGLIAAAVEANRTGLGPVLTHPWSRSLAGVAVGTLLIFPGSLLLGDRGRFVEAIVSALVGAAMVAWLVNLQWFLI